MKRHVIRDATSVADMIWIAFVPITKSLARPLRYKKILLLRGKVPVYETGPSAQVHLDMARNDK
jgi:hypothetical protein